VIISIYYLGGTDVRILPDGLKIVGKISRTPCKTNWKSILGESGYQHQIPEAEQQNSETLHGTAQRFDLKK
jgi:hypothetical protein